MNYPLVADRLAAVVAEAPCVLWGTVACRGDTGHKHPECAAAAIRAAGAIVIWPEDREANIEKMARAMDQASWQPFADTVDRAAAALDALLAAKEDR